jgi:hypothetical protein
MGVPGRVNPVWKGIIEASGRDNSARKGISGALGRVNPV